LLKQISPQKYFNRKFFLLRKKLETSEKNCLWFPMNSSIKFCLNFASNKRLWYPATLTKSFFRIESLWIDTRFFSNTKQSPDKRKKRASENLMLFNKKKSYDEESALKLSMTNRLMRVYSLYFEISQLLLHLNLFIFTHSILESI